MSTKVMVVEDESIVAMELSSYVEELGYEMVGRASNADDAYALALRTSPHIILMDVHLKGEEDGISLSKRLQLERETAIIYITAFNDDESLERAIETNPAAYLTKPFNRKELAAALKIALKSHEERKEDEVVGSIKIDGEFSFDPEEKALLCCGEYIHLTRKEGELLGLLIEAKRQVVDFYTLENSLWPEKHLSESTRRSLVYRLRSKLKHQFIESVSGIGYRMMY